MKKWLSLGLAALLVLCGLASCAKKNSDYFNFTYSDYLTLGEYKGVTVDAHDLDDAVDSAKESIISWSAPPNRIRNIWKFTTAKISNCRFTCVRFCAPARSG